MTFGEGMWVAFMVVGFFGLTQGALEEGINHHTDLAIHALEQRQAEDPVHQFMLKKVEECKK